MSPTELNIKASGPHVTKPDKQSGKSGDGANRPGQQTDNLDLRIQENQLIDDQEPGNNHGFPSHHGILSSETEKNSPVSRPVQNGAEAKQPAARSNATGRKVFRA